MLMPILAFVTLPALLWGAYVGRSARSIFSVQMRTSVGLLVYGLAISWVACYYLWQASDGGRVDFGALTLFVAGVVAYGGAKTALVAGFLAGFGAWVMPRRQALGAGLGAGLGATLMVAKLANLF